MSLVSRIRVQTDQIQSPNSPHILQDDEPRSHIIAVAARPHNLPKLLCVVILHDDGAAAIVVHDLVDGVEGAAADDVAGAALLPERDGVLAHVLEPHVLEHALALAVHALDLRRPDHAVAQRPARRHHEHRVLRSRVALVVALHPAVVLLPPAVVRRDVLRLRQRLRRAAEFERDLGPAELPSAAGAAGASSGQTATAVGELAFASLEPVVGTERLAVRSQLLVAGPKSKWLSSACALGVVLRRQNVVLCEDAEGQCSD